MVEAISGAKLFFSKIKYSTKLKPELYAAIWKENYTQGKWTYMQMLANMGN